MCRRGSLGALLVAALVGPWPASVSAQQPAEAELIDRIESLLPAYEGALAARDARLRMMEQQERRPTPTDTAQVGPMRIVALPDEIEVARELFGEVWREDFPGVTESPSLRGHTFAFQWRTRLRTLEVPAGPDAQVIRVVMSRVWAPTREHAKAVVADAVARALVQDFPGGSPMRTWLTAQAHPDAENVYRLLAATNSGATRECLAGNVSACQAALGFGLAGAADQLPGWFSAQDRREMVEEAALSGRVDRDGTLYRRCVEEDDARACDPVVQQLDWVTSVPVSDRFRAHVLWYATLEGGEEAWQRAIERREAPMPDVLAYVARRPIERLVADWRADVIEHRPDVHAGLGTRGTRVLLWSLIFAAFAMRSTRWRMG